MEDIVKILTRFGLSENEANTYVALLELDLASVSELSRHSGVNRSTAYVVLESLRGKGLARVSDDRKVRKFMALSPEVILEKAKNEADDREKLKSDIERIIPELKAHYKGTINKPIVKIYEGKEGLWQTYCDVFNTKIKEFRVYEDLSNILKIFPDFIEYDSVQRLKKGIDIYSIAPAKKEIINKCLIGPAINKEELLFIPEEKFKFPVDITIYGDKVAFASPKDLFGIIIEHKEIAAALKTGFDLAFAEAQRLNNKQNIKAHTPSYRFNTPEDKSKLPNMLKLLKETYKNPERFLEKPAKVV